MAGPLILPLRYFAPVRADVGLKVVENMEHRSCFSASTRSLDGLVSAFRVALVMAVAMTVERVGSKFCLHHNHVKHKRIAGENKKKKERIVQEESSSEDDTAQPSTAFKCIAIETLMPNDRTFYKPPAEYEPISFDPECPHFDWDSVNNDPNLELWAIRLPSSVRTF
jgi:hypothetical protein